jgi:hypothetical protein
MRVPHLIATVALFAAFVIGCSKSPSEPSELSKMPPNTTDLGAVELTPKTPKQFSLGTGKSCILTGSQLPDGIDVKLLVLITNADGTVVPLQYEMETSPGRQCVIVTGRVSVGFTPTLKAQ